MAQIYIGTAFVVPWDITKKKTMILRIFDPIFDVQVGTNFAEKTSSCATAFTTRLRVFDHIFDLQVGIIFADQTRSWTTVFTTRLRVPDQVFRFTSWNHFC